MTYRHTHRHTDTAFYSLGYLDIQTIIISKWNEVTHFNILFLTQVILGMRLHLHNYVILKKHGSRLMRQNINFLWWWGWYRTIHLECLTSFKKLTKKARSVPRKADMKAPPKMRKKYRRLSWENNILTRKNIAASYIRTSFHSASPVDDNISIRQHVPSSDPTPNREEDESKG